MRMDVNVQGIKQIWKQEDLETDHANRAKEKRKRHGRESAKGGRERLALLCWLRLCVLSIRRVP